jgi:hypothetical protein
MEGFVVKKTSMLYPHNCRLSEGLSVASLCQELVSDYPYAAFSQ